MQLRFLHVSGPSAAPANVDFVPGLNVINGPSNTGKSHILRLIDYVLGAQSPPEPIAEQALYDLVHVGVAMDDGSEKTLVRALQGGEVKIIDGLVKARPEPKQGTAVSARHGAKTSLSKTLLEQLGASGARIQTRAAGDTRDLSYRDLEKYAMITETKIQDTVSPVLTGQYVTKTPETAIFKYVLTGVDIWLSIWPSRILLNLCCVRPRNWNCSIIRFANSTIKSPRPTTTRKNWKSSICPSMLNWPRVFRSRKRPRATIAL